MKRPSSRSPDPDEAIAAFRPESPDLEFPIDPDFISKPPRLAWDVIFRRSEEHLQFKTRRSDFEERRLLVKIFEEFVL